MSIISKCMAVIIPIVTLAFAALYNGLCLVNLSFMDRDSLYDTAVREVIARYPPSIEMGRESLGDGRSVVRIDVPDNPLRYASVEEFDQLNSDCCALVDLGSEGYEPSFMSRLLGYESHIVRVRYKVRYMDKDSPTSISEPVEDHVVIGRCGKVYRP